MNRTGSVKIRALHRWLSIGFTLCVLANFAVMSIENETLGMAVGGVTLLPLVLLMGTGLYLFALPYAQRRTGGRVRSLAADPEGDRRRS